MNRTTNDFGLHFRILYIWIKHKDSGFSVEFSLQYSETFTELLLSSTDRFC